MKLRDLYASLDKEARDALAAKVGIKPAYLWQIATQWSGKKPSLDVLKKLADADKRLTVVGLVNEFTGTELEPRSPTNHPGERVTDKPAASAGSKTARAD